MTVNQHSGDRPWWREAVVYQIYPRSFCDTTGNGVGDLGGVRAHLDHLEWLGVDAIWLSPVFPSPMADHGYDVADYCDIDPLFGDLDVMDDLIEAAHERDIKVILDWVPNHTSEQHPWFVDSRESVGSPKRDWYVWRPGRGDGPPNNWQAVFPEGPAWQYDRSTDEWYLHSFTPEQPDLNWANPEVRAAMGDTLRFWLDRGVDGFRMDVVHLIGKDPALPDLADGPGSPILDNDLSVTHEYLREIRGVLDEYDGDRCSVGEVYLLDPAKVATYYGDGDELHMSFNFLAVWTNWNAGDWGELIDSSARAFDPTGAWPTWVLSNHDVTRHRQRFGGDERIARAAAVLLLGLRGTPYLYAGEEFGLVDAVVPAEMVQDPSGERDGCRAPIPWEPGEGHGWRRANNWLPFPPESSVRNAHTQREDPASIANLYRRLLAERRSSPALRTGDQEMIHEVPAGLLAWRRVSGADERVVLVNMTDSDVSVDFDTPLDVRVSSSGEAENGEGHTFTGRCPANSGMVLAPTNG